MIALLKVGDAHSILPISSMRNKLTEDVSAMAGMAMFSMDFRETPYLPTRTEEDNPT